MEIYSYNQHIRLLSPSSLVGFSTTNFTRAWEPTLSWNQLRSKPLGIEKVVTKGGRRSARTTRGFTVPNSLTSTPYRLLRYTLPSAIIADHGACARLIRTDKLRGACPNPAGAAVRRVEEAQPVLAVEVSATKQQMRRIQRVSNDRRVRDLSSTFRGLGWLQDTWRR